MCKIASKLIDLARSQPKLAIEIAQVVVEQNREHGSPVSSELSYIAGYDQNQSKELEEDYNKEFNDEDS